MSAVALAEQHGSALEKWNAQLVDLDETIQELVGEEEAVRIEWQRSNPSKRSDGVGSPVTELRRKIDELVGKRQRLLKDVQAKQVLLEELSGEAEAERQETELREAAEAIKAAEAQLAESWAVFVGYCGQARDQWAEVVEAASVLDALPAGVSPVSPIPSDLQRGFIDAIRPGAGTDPFAGLPRLVARRLPTVSSGTSATETTGFVHDLRGLGDF